MGFPRDVLRIDICRLVITCKHVLAGKNVVYEEYSNKDIFSDL